MTLLERILTTVILPALLSVALAPLGGTLDRDAVSVSEQAGAILFGTTTEENDLYALTIEAPDSVRVGETFTVTTTIEARTELEFVAMTLPLPSGVATDEPELREFQLGLAEGETLTGEFTMRATQQGTFNIRVDARAKPPQTESQALSAAVSVAAGQDGGGGDNGDGDGGEPPEASFTISPSEPEAGQDVTFDASGSSDPDGEIASFQWAFGDGTTEVTDGPTVTHAYSEPGDYEVTLTVVDADDNEASASETLTVVSGNEPPEATFSVAAEAPKSGQAITFDASGSSDPDGEIANYRWNFGDGTTRQGANRVTVQHTYEEPGAYTVRLVVTDNEGATARATTRLQVERPPTLLERVPRGVWIGAGVAATAGVGYLLVDQLFLQSGQQATAADGQVRAQIENRVANFLQDRQLPLQGVTEIERETTVERLNRAQWVRRLLNRAHIRIDDDAQGFATRQFSQLTKQQQQSLDPSRVQARSLVGYVSDRVAPGDTIYRLTWQTEGGRTLESWAVVSPEARVKLDTFISFAPLR